MARLVGLGREAEGHGAHVAVVGRARDEGHEQQVGQHIFEREADGDDELERPGADGIIEERLGHRQVPHAVMLVAPVLEAVVVLVVVGQAVDLRLRVADFVQRLHQAGHARAGAGELAAHVGEAPVRHVLVGRDARQEQLERVDVARIRHAQVAVVLREGVDDGVELALLLGLVLPVRVHRHAEGVLELVPVVDLDALVFHVREHVLDGLVGGRPGQVARHQVVALLEAQFLAGFHIHGECLLASRSGAVLTGSRSG